MLQYDGADYDLNALFQFDVLKKLIEALAKRQLEIDKKISMSEYFKKINKEELKKELKKVL